MKLAVTVVSPPGDVHSAAFHEVAESIHHGLLALGHDSMLTTEGALPGRRHIVLGANLLLRYPLPVADDAILYNFEQVTPGSKWFEPGLVDLYRRYTVWDYSERNAAGLAALGVQVARVVPVGYVKELTRIRHVSQPDIDVLFVGALNPRRREMLERMGAAGLRVTHAFAAYGEQRDALIGSASLMLNMHFYESRVLEIVRISYLLANSCAVLSERGADPLEDQALAGGVAFADYDELPRRARELIDAPEERRRLARRGFEIMAARPAAECLRAALA